MGIDYDKKLVEGLNENPNWVSSRYVKEMARAYGEFHEANPERELKEAKLTGYSDDGTPGAATVQALEQIIVGAKEYTPVEEFAKVFTADKATFLVPLGADGEAVAMSGGAFLNDPLVTTFATVNLDEGTEYGIEVSWTRAHLEDATWAVFAEQNAAAGRALASKLTEITTDVLSAGGTSTGSLASGTWADVVAFIGEVDVATYGPADVFMVPVADYWLLMGVEQFTNSLYAGNDEVMRTGIAKTTLGVTVVRNSHCDEEMALNKDKAVALVMRRNITVEPFEYPNENKYGFIASFRAKAVVMHALASVIAK